MAVSERKKGEWFLFSGTFLVALLPVIAVFSFANLSPLISLGWSTELAALFLGLVVLYRKKWHEIANPILWKYIFFIALFISVLTYGLFFLGLEKTTPGNAAVISLFEVFTSFVLFNVLRGERMSFEYKIGAFLMVAGALIVLVRDFSGINTGDLFILAATLCAPIGNLFQQKAREVASGETIMFLRSALSVPFIFLLAFVFNERTSFGDVGIALPFLLINGIVVLGFSRILWIEAIHRIPVTKAQALASIAPLFTLLFAWLLLHQVPNVWQLSAVVPLILGTLLLTDHIKFRPRAPRR